MKKLYKSQPAGAKHIVPCSLIKGAVTANPHSCVENTGMENLEKDKDAQLETF